MFDDCESMVKRFPDAFSAESCNAHWRYAYWLILEGGFERELVNDWHDEERKQKLSDAVNFVYGDVKNAKNEISEWVKDYDYLSFRSLMLELHNIQPHMTEILFDKQPKVKPLALFGFEKSIKGLPVYEKAVDYFLEKKK